MKTNNLSRLCYLSLFPIILVFFVGCGQGNNVQLTDKLVTDSVNLMTNNISRDLAVKGPVAWLDYFDDSPKFFMVSDGQLSFSDYPSAQKFIKDTLVKNMSKITLQWKDKRINIFSGHVASICSGFHEDITMANGQTVTFNGYFSGMVIWTPKGWKFANLHWSTPKPAH